MLRKIKNCGPEAVEVIAEKFKTPIGLFSALNELHSLEERTKFINKLQKIVFFCFFFDKILLFIFSKIKETCENYIHFI